MHPQQTNGPIVALLVIVGEFGKLFVGLLILSGFDQFPDPALRNSFILDIHRRGA